MAGSGYNIPISVSAAESFSMPTAFTAPTYINYGAGALFRDTGGSSTASPVQPATATSAAAEGNAAASTQGSGVAQNGTIASQATLSTTTIVLISAGLAAAAILAAYLISRR